MPGAFPLHQSLTRRQLLAQFAAVGVIAGQPPAPGMDPIRGLRTAHPRLILPDSELPRIQALARDFPLARRLHESLQREADKILTYPPLDFKFLGRRILDRICTLGLVYRMDRQPRYLDRALKEMRRAALFPNWNPQHFLDVAEMTYAFGIAYDWLYELIGDAERDWIAAAIVEKGLDPGWLRTRNLRAGWERATTGTWSATAGWGSAHWR